MGYDAVIVGNSHGGTRNGLLPDGFACGAKGHTFNSSDISAICVGHRAMHLLFADPPAYSAPEGYAAGGDLPAIGTLGQHRVRRLGLRPPARRRHAGRARHLRHPRVAGPRLRLGLRHAQRP
jgi:hypothetical protein